MQWCCSYRIYNEKKMTLRKVSWYLTEKTGRKVSYLVIRYQEKLKLNWINQTCLALAFLEDIRHLKICTGAWSFLQTCTKQTGGNLSWGGGIWAGPRWLRTGQLYIWNEALFHHASLLSAFMGCYHISPAVSLFLSIFQSRFSGRDEQWPSFLRSYKLSPWGTQL